MGGGGAVDGFGVEGVVGAGDEWDPGVGEEGGGLLEFDEDVVGVVAEGEGELVAEEGGLNARVCLLYTSPSPRDSCASRMPSSA